jgi:hypothetical protein
MKQSTMALVLVIAVVAWFAPIVHPRKATIRFQDIQTTNQMVNANPKWQRPTCINYPHDVPAYGEKEALREAMIETFGGFPQ